MVAKGRGKCQSFVRSDRIGGVSRENTENREWMLGNPGGIISQVETENFKERTVKVSTVSNK